MKTALLTVSSALMLIASANAQITLTDTSYTATFAGTTDSVSIAYGSLPTLATGTNANWDLSTISYAIVDTPYLIHNAAPLTYTYADYVHNIIYGNIYYNSRPYFRIDSTGLKQYGESVDGRSYGLFGAIAGANNTDSIIFPPQMDPYSSTLTKIGFPATYNSNWSSNYTSDIHFTLTYASFYNNAPGILRGNVTEYDTVIGWGKMKVKRADGTPSALVDVLQIKVNYQRTDSFFVGGTPTNPTPASPLLLSQFGLTQGNITTSYEYRYVRANEVTPLVNVYFVNSNYSNTNVNKTVVHQQRLDSAGSVSVATLETANDILVYPNPVSNHTLHVDLGGNTQMSYRLSNILGQNIATGSLSANNGKNTIQIPQGTAAGIYYLGLTDNKNFYVKQVNIIR